MNMENTSNMSVLNSVDELDFILYEDLFNKYIEQKNTMKAFISRLNNPDYNVHPDFIQFPAFILNDEDNTDNFIKDIISNLNKMVYDFNKHIFHNINTKEVKCIIKKINTLNLLIEFKCINKNNYKRIIDFIQAINVGIQNAIASDIANFNSENLMSSILDYNNDTEFLLNYIDENY
jgi:hypothetical protein